MYKSTNLTPEQIDDMLCDSSLEGGDELIGILLDDFSTGEISRQQNIDWAKSLTDSENNSK